MERFRTIGEVTCWLPYSPKHMIEVQPVGAAFLYPDGEGDGSFTHNAGEQYDQPVLHGTWLQDVLRGVTWSGPISYVQVHPAHLAIAVKLANYRGCAYDDAFRLVFQACMRRGVSLRLVFDQRKPRLPFPSVTDILALPLLGTIMTQPHPIRI